MSKRKPPARPPAATPAELEVDARNRLAAASLARAAQCRAELLRSLEELANRYQCRIVPVVQITADGGIKFELQVEPRPVEPAARPADAAGNGAGVS